jgi:hypothetical protein
MKKIEVFDGMFVVRMSRIIALGAIIGYLASEWRGCLWGLLIVLSVQFILDLVHIWKNT